MTQERFNQWEQSIIQDWPTTYQETETSELISDLANWFGASLLILLISTIQSCRNIFKYFPLINLWPRVKKLKHIGWWDFRILYSWQKQYWGWMSLLASKWCVVYLKSFTTRFPLKDTMQAKKFGQKAARTVFGWLLFKKLPTPTLTVIFLPPNWFSSK